MKNEALVADEIKRLKKTVLSPTEKLNNMLKEADTTPVSTGITLAELMRRPQITYAMLEEFDGNRPQLDKMLCIRVQNEVKYEGYIKRQRDEADKSAALSKKQLPQDIDYSAIGGLRLEARQKLEKIRPQDLGQASRISGVSPADISVLLIYLKKYPNKKD